MKTKRQPARTFDMNETPTVLEPDTGTGVLHQAMRNSENIVKTMLDSQNYMAGILAKENQRLSRMLKQFVKQQIELVSLVKEIWKRLDHKPKTKRQTRSRT